MRTLFLLLTISILLLLSQGVYSQYDPKFTQVMYSGLAHNPAFSGYLGGFNGRLFYRNQFTGLHSTSGVNINNPQVASMYIDDFIGSINSGVGVQFDFETFGPMYNNSLIANYAYSIKLHNRGDILNLGVSVGFFQYGIYNGIFSSDDIAFAQALGINLIDKNVWRPNFRFGALYHYHFYFASIAITDLFNDPTTTSRVPVMHISGGYLFDFNPTIKLRTMIHYREDFNKNPSMIDINAMGIFIDRIWFGALYRMSLSTKSYRPNFQSLAAGVLARVDITPNINIGYAYEIPLNSLNYGVHYGSHEITLGVNFIKPSKFVSPRYF